MPVERLLEHLESMRERGALRRVAAILFHRRAGFSANGMGVWKVPEERILELGPRMARSAASRTATSGRPTRTGPTRSSRWPTGARRRSATRSSTRSPRTTGHRASARRSTRSTEFKKIRMLYFTGDFSAGSEEHALSYTLTDARSAELYARAADAAARRRQLARARDALDRPRPDLHRARRGRRARRRRRQPLRRLGLLVGPADPRPRAPRGGRGGDRGRRAGHELRRADRRPRSSWPRRSSQRMPERRDGAHDLVGHRGVDERDPAGARGDRPRDSSLKFAGAYHGHVDGLLAEAGSGPGHAGHPGVARRDRRRRPPTRSSCRGTTPRRCERAFAEHEFAAILVRALPGQHGPRPAGRRLPRAAARAGRPSTARCWSSTRSSPASASRRGGAQELDRRRCPT